MINPQSDSLNLQVHTKATTPRMRYGVAHKDSCEGSGGNRPILIQTDPLNKYGKSATQPESMDFVP